METDEHPLTKAERKAIKKQQKQEGKQRERQRQILWRIGKYLGLLVGLVVIGWAIYNGIVPIPEKEKNKPIDQIMADDWVRGNRQALVKIVEYSDFQCPSCARITPILDEVLKSYPTQVGLAYRHFPLKGVHMQADLAAQAAEAAGKQGKFWEMHDLLFKNQSEWAQNRSAQGLFEQYARDLGLQMDQFKRDLKSREVRGAVQADYMSGLEHNLSSTPSFFINGELVLTAKETDAFKQIIDQKLIEATTAARYEFK